MRVGNTLAFICLAVAVGGHVAACSSDSSNGSGDSGSGVDTGQDTSMSADTGGSSSGSGSGSGSSSGGDDGGCADAGTCAACGACFCNAEETACGSDPMCVKQINCMNDCFNNPPDGMTVQACQDACKTQYPSTAAAPNLACSAAHCMTQCSK